jgi:hypothetical protein
MGSALERVLPGEEAGRMPALQRTAKRAVRESSWYQLLFAAAHTPVFAGARWRETSRSARVLVLGSKMECWGGTRN